jgi:hypothetical protein
VVAVISWKIPAPFMASFLSSKKSLKRKPPSCPRAVFRKFNSAVALIQVWLPQWADGLWIASSDLPGRAIGNFRQSNHLALLLLWSLVAAAALHALRRLPAPALWVAVVLMVLALELSASRLGAAGLLLLALWGAVDRRLMPGARLVLVVLPLL